MIKYIVSGIAIALVAFILNLLIYLGAFKDVEIQISEEAPINLIYKEHLGSYHKIVPLIEEVETWAKSQGIDCTQSFGEYLDNPDKVQDDRRRSHGGCLVSEIPKNLPPEILSKQIPASRFIKAVFSGSPSIGPYKVYSNIRKFANKERLKLKDSVIEIYVIKSEKEMTTTYLFGIE